MIGLTETMHPIFFSSHKDVINPSINNRRFKVFKVMTVKYEDEIHDYLKEHDQSSTIAISLATGRTYRRVWIALTELEVKGLVYQEGKLWYILNDPK